MKNLVFALSVILSAGFTILLVADEHEINQDDLRFVSHTVNLKIQTLRFYWRNDKGRIYGNFPTLRDDLSKRNEELVFAMNGGMFNKDYSPQGLYVENSELLSKLDETEEGYGNFYLQPNGVFYINEENLPVICKTTVYQSVHKVKYATQSGPLLLIDGKIHPRLINGSTNLHIRNGVGVLPNGFCCLPCQKKQSTSTTLHLTSKARGVKTPYISMVLYQEHTFLQKNGPKWTETLG